MAVKVGIDARGRRYKTVNGKRVQATEDPGSSPRESKPQDIHALRTPIRNALRRAIHGGDSGVEEAISQVLQSRFNELLSTTAKTSVGRYGQLYAARYLLAALRTGDFTEPEKEDTEKLKSMVSNGVLDTKKFRDYLESQGVDVGPPVTKATEVPPDDDARILEICHKNGITSQKLLTLIPSPHDIDRDAQDTESQA